MDPKFKFNQNYSNALQLYILYNTLKYKNKYKKYKKYCTESVKIDIFFLLIRVRIGSVTAFLLRRVGNRLGYGIKKIKIRLSYI